MTAVRNLLLAVLFGCFVTSAAMAQNVIFKGAGVVSKSSFILITVKGMVTVVLDASNDKAMRFGYKAVFPDGSEEKLALVLKGDVLREDGARRGEAQLLVHSGEYHREDGFAGASGTWFEVDDADRGFRAEFSREDGSKLVIVTSFEPSTIEDAVPDMALTITVHDLPQPGIRGGDVFDWKILSRPDFNALMRDEDTSVEALLEELFGSQGTE